jgi:capsular polysaccharide transport system permease protein
MTDSFDEFEERVHGKGIFKKIAPFAVQVALPALLVAGAGRLIAAPRYPVEFEFSVVNAAQSGAVDVGATAAAASYLKSDAAVAALGRRMSLAAMYKDHGMDPTANFWWDDGSTAKLAQYWRGFVLRVREKDGVARVRVVAYAPQDAQTLASSLIDMANDVVGSPSVVAMGTRAQLLASAAARQDAVVADSEAQVIKARADAGSVDPSQAILAREQQTAQLQAQLTAAQAERDAIAGRLVASAPAVIAVNGRIASLSAQIAALRDPDAITRFAKYEDLLQKRDDARAMAVALHKDTAEAFANASQGALSVNAFVPPVAPQNPVMPRYWLPGAVLFVILCGLFAWRRRA